VECCEGGHGVVKWVSNKNGKGEGGEEEGGGGGRSRELILRIDFSCFYQA
jgi:hypothetical protein